MLTSRKLTCGNSGYVQCMRGCGINWGKYTKAGYFSPCPVKLKEFANNWSDRAG